MLNRTEAKGLAACNLMEKPTVDRIMLGVNTSGPGGLSNTRKLRVEGSRVFIYQGWTTYAIEDFCFTFNKQDGKIPLCFVAQSSF
jgi:hypothetical protein